MPRILLLDDKLTGIQFCIWGEELEALSSALNVSTESERLATAKRRDGSHNFIYGQNEEEQRRTIFFCTS